MALNEQLVAELIRQRLGDVDDSRAARYISLIPQALKETGRVLAADPFTRQLVTTNRETTFIALGADGKLNLSTGYDDYQFLLEYFDKGDVYFLPSAPMSGTFATGTLTIAPAGGSAATGHLTVSVPSGYSTGTLTITQGVQATGSYVVATLPSAGNTIVLAGTTFTFAASPLTSTDIPIATTVTSQAVAIINALYAYTLSNPASPVAQATYTSSMGSVFITSTLYTTAGNSFTTTATGGHVTASQATLAGGVSGAQPGEIVYVNGVECIFEFGNSTSRLIRIGVADNDATVNAASLAQALTNAPNNSDLSSATYTAVGNVVRITYNTPGAVGGTYVLANSNLGAVVASGATLAGGTGGIVEGETIVVNTVSLTFSNYVVNSTHIPYSATGNAVESATLFSTFLNASSNVLLNIATYSTSLPPPAQQTDDDVARSVLITYDTTGTAGNSYALAHSSGSGVVPSAATLLGGVAGTVVNNETLAINGFTVTFKSSAGAFPEVQIGATPTLTAANLATGLSASVNALLTFATYSSSGPVVTILDKTPGTAGNTYTLAYSSQSGVTPSALTLLGGSGGADVASNTFTIDSFTDYFANLDRVRFTSTDSFPDPLDVDIDYYIVNYTVTAGVATFQLASDAAGTDLVVLTGTGVGILTMTKFSGNDIPMQMLANPQLLPLPPYLSSEFQYFAIQDGLLSVLPIDGAIAQGQIGFAVPYFPTNLAALPDSTEAERWFLDTLANMVAVPVMDAAA